MKTKLEKNLKLKKMSYKAFIKILDHQILKDTHLMLLMLKHQLNSVTIINNSSNKKNKNMIVSNLHNKS